VARRAKRSASPCQWGGSCAHSNDTVAVFRGSTEPLILCGYHAMRWEVGPQETRDKLIKRLAEASREEVMA
jgi:hypothetical protein